MVIVQIDLEDKIGKYSPLPVGINVDTEEGGLNVRDSLSNRAMRAMYKALEEELAKMGTVLPHMDRQKPVQVRFPGWPQHTVQEGLATGADYAVQITGTLQARRLAFRVKGISGSRLVPVVSMQVRIYDSKGRLVRKVQGKEKGDPSLGGMVQTGDWQVGTGNVVLEKEIIALIERLVQRLL